MSAPDLEWTASVPTPRRFPSARAIMETLTLEISTGLGLTPVPLALQRTGSDQDLALQGTCRGPRTRSPVARPRTETLPGSQLDGRRVALPLLHSSRSSTVLLATPSVQQAPWECL